MFECPFLSKMTQLSISQENFRTDFGVNNRSIFAPKVSKSVTKYFAKIWNNFELHINFFQEMTKKCVSSFFYVVSILKTVFSHLNSFPSGLSKGFFHCDDQSSPLGELPKRNMQLLDQELQMYHIGLFLRII